MLGFKYWLLESLIKKKRKEKYERSISHSGQENGVINQQGEADRLNQEIPPTIIHFVPEP